MASVLNRRLVIVLTKVCEQQSKKHHSLYVARKSLCGRRDRFGQTKQTYLRLCQTWPRQASSDNVVRSPVPDITIFDETIPQYVWKNVDKYSNLKALTCGISGRSYNFREARDASRKFGGALLKSGLKPGDVLGVMLPNMPEYALILLGALEAGILVSTINPLYGKNEITHQLTTSEAKCMVTLPSLVSTVQSVVNELETKVPIITVSYDEGRGEGSWDLHDMINSNVNQSVLSSRASAPDDVAILPFSSGTTGLSKGVRLTHKNIVTNIRQLLAPSVNHLQETTSEHQDVFPSVLPFFHIYGMTITLFRGISQGIHVITLPKFDPQAYINIISSQKPLTCVCYCVPPLIMFLGSHPLVKSEDLKSVRVVTNGAGPVGPSDIEKLLSKVPSREDFHFFNAYGLTETSPVVFSPLEGNTDLMTVGCPMPNTEIRVVDSTGKNLGPGEHGEIYVKGPQVMKGYYKNDTANSEAFENNWFKTGDIGYYDEQSRFYIVERLKDLIKVKGFQVPPAELEAVLRSHPHVADAGVIGVPDERTGEKPVAFVVPKPGIKFESDKVSEFVAEQVAPFKKLGAIILTDAIPKNPTGKILRKALKDQYLKGH